MRKKVMSVIISAVMVVSISASMAKNVGEPGSSETLGLPIPNISFPNPQIGGQPSSSSSGTVHPTLTKISAPIPQIVGQPISSSTGGLADSPWPMFRQNLNHTGLSPYDTSTNTGHLKWSFQTGDRVQSSPTIGSDGTIYVGSWDNKLYAINPDGSEKWIFETGYRIGYSSPTIGSDGTIYVGSWDNKLYAINPDGTEKWNFITGDLVDSTPIIDSNGTIYVGSYDDKLYAINPDGTEKWNLIIGGDVYSSPTISSDGTIYVGSSEPQPTFHAINPDGTEKWRFFTGDDIYSSPAIGSDGTIYIGSFDYKLYAINPDGTEKWIFSTDYRVYSSPAIGSDGTIYVGSYDDKFYAINPDGTEKWNFMTGDSIHSSPAIGADGTIYVGSDDKKVYAINQDGTEKWNFWIGKPIWSSSPAIDSDGTIYVGSWDGKLYAIGISNIPPITDAGPDQSVNEGDAVPLNGSASYDPDGIIETYEWDFESDGIYDYVETTNSSPDGAFDGKTTNIYGDNGIYIVTLRVTDDTGLNDTDTCNITVNNVPPNITLLIVPSDYEGSQLTFEAEATDPGSDDLTFSWEFEYGPTIENIYYNDGVGPEPIYDPITNEVKSPGGTSPFNVSDTVTHTYGDNYDYFLILRVKDDDDGMTVINTTIAVDNIAPSITKFAIPLDIFEGSKATFQAAAKDLGSDDLTFTWEFEQGPSVTNTYYNDGMSPDPYPSPWGNFSFIAQDTVDHIYGDNGKFYVILTVTDDDNGTTTFNTTVTVNNVAPKVDALLYATIDEGETVTFTGHVTDPGSDDLTFTWTWEYVPWGDKTTIYYNDGAGPDPFPSPTFNPRNISEDATCQYGDNGVFVVTLTITDDDGGSTIVMTNVTVNNVAPIVTIESMVMDVEIGLRVAGRKYNNVSMTIFEDGNSIGYVSIERLPGSPNEQMAWIPVILNMTKTYNATVTYTPEDPPKIGANPVWIYIKFKNGSTEKIRHTFNVQQSKKRDSDHWNHVEPWEVDLNAHLIGCNFEVTSHITDPGSDDEVLTYTYGSQTVTVKHMNNPPNPDPFPSPQVKLVDITDTTTLVYEGPGTVTLVVKDDDNIRLGVGEGSDSIDIG